MRFYEPGKYRCLVTEQAYQNAKSGIPMIVWKIRPEYQLFERIGNDGEVYVDEERTSQQYERRVYFAISEDKPEQLDYAIRKLRHAGFTGTSFDELDFTNCDVVFECKPDTYNNQPSEKWELPLPGRSSAPLQSDGAIPRKLNAIFGRRLTENEGAKAQAPAAQPAMAAAGGGGAADDDDIPF